MNFGGQRAARAALGRGEGCAPLGEHAVDELLHGGGLVAHDVAGDEAAQRLELALDFALGSAALDFVGREPQAHRAGIGQVGQAEVGGQGLLPCGDALGEHRLGESRGDERAVDDLAQRERLRSRGMTSSCMRCSISKGTPGGEITARPSRSEPHAGAVPWALKSTVHAAGTRACARFSSLYSMPRAGEHAFDVGGDRLVADHAAAEECGERLLGDVVLRGAQTSGQHDDLRVAERALHGFGDACGGVVAHRVLGEHDDARGVEGGGRWIPNWCR